MGNKLKKLKEMYKDMGYNKQFIFLFILIESTVIMEIFTIPYIIKNIINIEIPEKNILGLLIFSAIYIILLLIQCYMVLKHCDMRCILKRKVQRDLREKVFNKLQDVKTKFYDDNEAGVILQYLQTDTQEAGALFPEIIVEMCFMGLARFTIIAIFMMFVDIKITFFILLIYIIGFLITLYFNKKTVKIINDIRKINILLYSLINEGINGFLTIKILNIVKEKEEELKSKLQEYNDRNNLLEKIISIYNNIFLFITSFSTSIIIYTSGINMMEGIASYSQIVLLLEYSGQLEYEFKWFTKHLTDFNKSFVSYSKILEFLKLENVEDLERGSELEKINSIEFKKVHFSYNGNQKNISDFSLKLDENKKVALVGKTGAGKTTITGLLCRFYEPIKGEILINGINYKEYNLESLRKRIGYVMQEVEIFPNTIIDNIRYSNKNITVENIEKIFKKLKLHDKIVELEKGYETDIYNNPDILSTGEKQLINFARIMALDTDVIILDEVTSALSCETEMLVENAINQISKGKIVIIVAHRLSTIKNCDEIIFMKDGKIVERGTHEELLEQNGKYYDLYNVRNELLKEN